MNARTSPFPVRRISRKTSRVLAQIEPLEGRTLLSAAWSTVDSDPSGLYVWNMAADKGGNVYVAGSSGNGGVATLQEKASGSSSWTTIWQDVSGNSLTCGVATDVAGDVFIGEQGAGGPPWSVLERPAGQSGFSVVDSLAKGTFLGLASDGAGDVYAVGENAVTTTSKGKTTTTNYATVRKLAAGQSAFTTVYQSSAINFGGDSFFPGKLVTAIDSGASAGVYVLGTSSGNWAVVKSGNGGQTWSQVDSFRYDPTAPSYPNAVVGDSAGNVYVAGEAYKPAIVGYNSTNHKPIYKNISHWLVRKSGNGGASWSINDDFQLTANASAKAYAAGVDLAGNVYVAGEAFDSTSHDHAIVRSNAGGSWSVSDDYTGYDGLGAEYNAFVTDSTGNLYAAGTDDNGWLIRSQPAAPTNLTAAADAIFPSSQIDLSWSNTAGSDETGFAVYRSTDGINFTAVATVAAGATTYSDTGLSAGTTYYYYVVTLLNATGKSGPSNQVSAATST